MARNVAPFHDNQMMLDLKSNTDDTLRMLIYKIFRFHEWEAFEQNGKTQGAPIDLEDGFIHFSTAEQAPETARKHFSGQSELVLVAVEADRLGGALKWEQSRGGALFPHLYRDLSLTEISWSKQLPLRDGAHLFPKELA